jgi:magnesium chelatase family protein
VVDIARIDDGAIIARAPAECSADVAKRVAAARELQESRLSGTEAYCNAHMTNRDIQKYCNINNETTKLAAHAMRNLGLSARGYSRILKVARTIADLEGVTEIAVEHFSEAMQYRRRN